MASHIERTELDFVYEKETKNTVRFTESQEGKPPIIGTLYIQKWVFKDGVPNTLKVTIE